MLNTILKSPEFQGILGFEYIKKWRVIEEEERGAYIMIAGVVDSGIPPRFTLVHSSFKVDSNLPAHYYFIVSRVIDNVMIVNTRAPVVIDNGEITQELLDSGSVREELQRNGSD